MPSVIFSPKSLQVYNNFQINCHDLYPSYHKYYHFFFYLGFLSQTFTIHRTAGEGGDFIFLTPLYHHHSFHRHLNITRAVTEECSAHSQQSNSNRKLLVSERKSLTTKLRTFNHHGKNGCLSPSTQYGFVLFREDLGLLNIIQ